MVDHANVITHDIEDIAEEEGGSGIQPVARQDDDEDEDEVEDGDFEEEDEDETQA